MIAEGSAGAADASAGTPQTSQSDGGQRTEDRGQANKEVFGTPVGEILAGMEDLPEDVRQSEAAEAAKEQGERQHGAAEAVKEQGERQQGAESKEQGAEGEHRPAADATKTADAAKPPATGEDHPVPNEWPADAKARVADEAGKRRKRTEERDTAIRERDEFKSQVEQLQKRQPVTVSPTAQDPLSDVTDEQGLVRAHADYEKLLEWATINGEGIEGVQIGLDAQQQPIVRDYSKGDMAKIRLDCGRILRNAIPQKADYLATRKAIEPIARETYPNLFAEGTPERAEFELIQQQLPEITRFPDYQMWIGDAIYRRNERLAAAKAAAAGKEASATVAALLNNAKTAPKAPPAVISRGPRTEDGGQRSGREQSSDVVKDLEQKAINSGGDDAAIENLVGATLGTGARRHAGEPALV